MVAPTAQSVWSPNQSQKVQWTFNSQLVVQDKVKIVLLRRVGSALVNVAVMAEEIDNSGVFSWLVPVGTANGTYAVEISATVEGRLFRARSNRFLIQ